MENMNRILIIITLFSICWSINAEQFETTTCPESCDLQQCNVPEEECLAGLIKDKCNCCFECGRREGERCYNDQLKHKVYQSYQHYSDCGDNMECRIRTDLEPDDKPEAICYCTKTEPICGTDGTTYENECKFTEARYKKRDRLFKAEDGPCKSSPQIATPPKDITNNTGSSVAFSCEVRGWPIPAIEWLVDHDGVEHALPSDNSHIIVLSRGGPNNYETTSWLQLVDVTPQYSGTYICLGKNSLGEAKASAYLTVGNFKKSFPQDDE